MNRGNKEDVAVGSMSRVNPRIRDPLLPRRYCRVLPWCLLYIVPPGRQRDRKKSEKKICLQTFVGFININDRIPSIIN